MADMDYGKSESIPGNYDDYMLASTQARERSWPRTPSKENPDRGIAGRS